MLEIIIKELSEHSEGMSYWSLYKICKNKYSVNVEQSAVRYHMEKLHKNGFLEKKGSKYILPAPVIAINGAILFTNPPAMINCPYYNSCNRNVSICLGENCKFYNAFSDELKGYIDAIKNDETEVEDQKKVKSSPKGN